MKQIDSTLLWLWIVKDNRTHQNIVRASTILFFHSTHFDFICDITLQILKSIIYLLNNEIFIVEDFDNDY